MTSPSRPLSTLVNSSGTLHPNASSTSLITREITLLADPTPHSVDSHLVDFLLNETVRILIESTLHNRLKRKREREEIDEDLRRLGFNDKPTGTGAVTEVDMDQQVKDKIEQIGFKLGYATAERLTRDRPRFPSTLSSTSSSSTTTPTTPSIPIPDTLESIKFICKDVWVSLFDKQVDNLRTNHRGVYVLLDNRLRFLERLSPSGDKDQVARWSKFLLKFPEGVVRGSLANLGIQVSVSSESNNLPQASFQIKTNTVKP
ncbi:hypothetical protein JCM16303_006058 [Sporobolomyces ruberrimus]